MNGHVLVYIRHTCKDAPFHEQKQKSMKKTKEKSIIIIFLLGDDEKCKTCVFNVVLWGLITFDGSYTWNISFSSLAQYRLICIVRWSAYFLVTYLLHIFRLFVFAFGRKKNRFNGVTSMENIHFWFWWKICIESLRIGIWWMSRHPERGTKSVEPKKMPTLWNSKHWAFKHSISNWSSVKTTRSQAFNFRFILIEWKKSECKREMKIARILYVECTASCRVVWLFHVRASWRDSSLMNKHTRTTTTKTAYKFVELER